MSLGAGLSGTADFFRSVTGRCRPEPDLLGMGSDRLSGVPYRPWVAANSTRRAAGVHGQSEPQDVDGLFGAPQQGALTRAEPAQPVASGVTETTPPVVVERGLRPHLAIEVRLESRLLNAPTSAPIHP